MMTEMMTEITWFTIIDLGLISINAFHILVGGVPKVLPSWVAFKKSSIKFQYNILTKLQSVPFLTLVVNMGLLALTVFLALDAKTTNDVPTVCRAFLSGFAFLCALFLQKLGEEMILLGQDRTLEIETELDQRDMINFKPLPKSVCKAILSPIEAILRPECHGLDNVPADQPALYVMNHSLMGLEMASFVNCLYQNKDIFVRGLADHFHFMSPHGDFLRNVGGAVDGTRANVDCLMEAKQNVLVYPGGGHEVMKHSSVPKYELLWKQRLGFARMAIKHGYPIVPCAAVGTEDMLDIVADIPVKFIRKDLTCPVVVPNGMQRVYFFFGEPIPTAHYNGDYQNDAFAKEVRDKAKAAVLGGIKQMKERQQNDPDRFLLDQVSNKMLRITKKAQPPKVVMGTVTPPAGQDTVEAKKMD